MVVHTTLTPDSSFNVILTKTRSLYDIGAPDTIVEADVKIFQGMELKAQLTIPSTTDGFFPVFRATSVKPEIGATYDLKIELPNDEVLTTSTTLPENFQISDLKVNAPKVIPPTKNYDSITVESTLFIENIANTNRFYHLAEVQLVIEYLNLDGTVDTNNPPEHRRLPVQNIEIDNQHLTTLVHEPGFLIDDSSLKGNYKFLISTRRNSNERLKELKVFVRHVDKAYYKYHQLIALQMANRDDPFSIPVSVPSNIENGLGNFSGYVTQSITGVFE